MEKELENKIKKIYSIFNGKKVVIAFSGGVDSTIIAFLAKKSAKKVICCTFYNPIFLKEDLIIAKKMAKEIDIDHKIIEVNNFPEVLFQKNPRNRCYICKKTLMKHLIAFKNKSGFDIIVDGTNLDDLKEYRPGITALKELNIMSPFILEKITKKEIRKIGKFFKISNYNSPNTTCLLSRIPYNEEITIEKLEMIKKSEDFLKRMLKTDVVRVRHYELSNKIYLARIELKKEKIIELFEEPELNIQKIINELKKLGYTYLTIDLEGYRSGSMDQNAMG